MIPGLARPLGVRIPEKQGSAGHCPTSSLLPPPPPIMMGTAAVLSRSSKPPLMPALSLQTPGRAMRMAVRVGSEALSLVLAVWQQLGGITQAWNVSEAWSLATVMQHAKVVDCSMINMRDDILGGLQKETVLDPN